mmetsp:Transcript_67344/g.217450  ORF Transcript_67344/g.217450 Transcript_67344/m.217450 type:complete len:351 (+) Transcript_67344:537-1589(+)
MPFGTGLELQSRCMKSSFLSMFGAGFTRCSTRVGSSMPPFGPNMSHERRRCVSAKTFVRSLVDPVADTSTCWSLQRFSTWTLRISSSRWSLRETFSSMSTSSKTTARSLSKDRRPSMAWSRRRPGVPTTTCGRSYFRWSSCHRWLAPPMRQLALSRWKGARSSLTMRAVCAASSRLGHTTSNDGVHQTFLSMCTGVLGSIFLSSFFSARCSTCRCSSGSRKQSVLPAPVPAVRSTSSPSRMAGSALACSTLGRRMPRCASFRTTSPPLPPKMPSSAQPSSAGSVQARSPATSSQGSGVTLRSVALYILTMESLPGLPSSSSSSSSWAPFFFLCFFFRTFAGMSQPSRPFL